MFKFLDNITGKWAKQWVIGWFLSGCLVTFLILSITIQSAQNKWLEIFKSIVAIVGYACVVSLSFRKNLLGNGLGITSNIGEIISQGLSGAIGLALSPFFYLMTHIFGLTYWSKHKDGDGNMIPQKANWIVWAVTLGFITVGLLLFPIIDKTLGKSSFISNYMGEGTLFYYLNMIAFVCGVTAQTVMILRYPFSWWLWVLVNLIWLVVNIINKNWIFAGQSVVYQVNAFVGLYEWYKTEKRA